MLPRCSVAVVDVASLFAMQVPAGVKPFFFGWHMNKNSLWEVCNFSHSDYPPR